jgi:hypothetical protein
MRTAPTRGRSEFLWERSGAHAINSNGMNLLTLSAEEDFA